MNRDAYLNSEPTLDPQFAPSVQYRRQVIALVQIPARGAKIPHSESGHRDGNRQRCERPGPALDGPWRARLPSKSTWLQASDTALLPTVLVRPIIGTIPRRDRMGTFSAFPEDLERKSRDPYDTSEYMAATFPGAGPDQPAAASDNPGSMVQTGQDRRHGIAG